MSELRVEAKGQGECALVGEIDVVSVLSVPREIEHLLRSQDELTLDLSGVTRSSSVGVALMLECLRLAKKHDKVIRFRRIPEQMLTIAKVSGLDQHFPVVA